MINRKTQTPNQNEKLQPFELFSESSTPAQIAPPQTPARVIPGERKQIHTNSHCLALFCERQTETHPPRFALLGDTLGDDLLAAEGCIFGWGFRLADILQQLNMQPKLLEPRVGNRSRTFWYFCTGMKRFPCPRGIVIINTTNR